MYTALGINLTDPHLFAQRVPWAEWADLQQRAPVAWLPESPRAYFGPPAAGYWAVTRYADVVEVSRHPERFSSAIGATQIADPPTEFDLAILQQMMLNMDPPAHGRLRRLVAREFTPRAITRLHQSIKDNAREIVDDLIEAGPSDFVAAVAAEMPLRVLADLLGVPREDRHLLFDWSNRTIGAEDPEYGGGFDDFQAAFNEMFAYGHALAEERSKSPRDDLTSLLLQRGPNGEGLSLVEFDMFWFLLIIAGNETTRNQLAGSVLTLDQHPDQRAWLLDDLAARLPVATEELLRFWSPVVHFRRTAAHDTELAGQTITAGEKVVVFYPAANRDPSVFADPHRLDLTRNPVNHLAFGSGPHFCLGSHLAKLEIVETLHELYSRVPDLAVAGEPERTHSAFINGLNHLPVSFSRP